MPVMRRLGEFPFVVALRDALPWSFVGPAAAFVVILALQLVWVRRGTDVRTCALRVRFCPPLASCRPRSSVVLPLRFARAANYGARPLLAR